MSTFLGVGPAEFDVQNFFPKSIIKVNSQRFQRQKYDISYMFD